MPPVAVRLLLGAVVMFSIASSVTAQQRRSFGANISFNFDSCRDEPSSWVDEAIERFLREKAFQVLNEPRRKRERNAEPRPIDFHIDAVDDNLRMIRIGPNGSIVHSHFLHYYSPPPTHHSEAEEEELLTFFSDVLGCRIRGIVRQENGPETGAYYAEVFRGVRNRIREANGDL
jgi:hypothetical protein